MEAVKEITGGLFPPHVYLLDGNNLIAYIQQHTTVPFFFKKPIKGFDKRGRKFEKLELNPFDVSSVAKDPDVVEVAGSKGAVYTVNTVLKTCTCPGYTFRGACKHIA